LLDDESNNLEGFLISPVVDFRHGEIIQEAEHLLATNRSEDTGLEFGNLTFNRGLDVRRSGGAGEINSLERVGISIEFSCVHKNDGSLSSTSGTNKQGVLKTLLSTVVISLKGQSRNLINDVLRTSRITGRDKQLREHDLLRSIPGFGLPDSPLFGLGVNEIIKDSFLLVELLLGTDLR
jgi:hypothetical protein